MISRRGSNFMHTSWFWVAGFLAFLWMAIRSGTNPKRITYPCQQAAAPLAASWLAAVLSLFGGGLLLRRCVVDSVRILVAVSVVWLLLTIPDFPRATPDPPGTLPVWEVDDPVSLVFAMDSIPPTSGSLAAGDETVPDEFLSDPAIDTLLLMMENRKISFHRTSDEPSGIVGPDDIVIIKGNFQWTSRNTTSTDRIKGLVKKILDHPDGFEGEILICDNTQEIGTGLGENDNNSEDEEQSLPDVVSTFAAKGYPVYLYDWSVLWSIVVGEYSEGDDGDGYVYEASSKISYPKFRTPVGGNRVSLRYGVWDPDESSYDPERLCIIDVPVLKAHSLAGSTIAIKNWIGVLTTAYSVQRYGGSQAMHDTYFWGDHALVARVMAETFPRLTIVDAAWTTTYGPINLDDIVNTQMLFASTDPAAVSWYAAKFALTPIAIDDNNTDPDLPGSDYHDVLTCWTTFLQNEGFACTMDSTRVSAYDRSVLEPTLVEDPTDVPVFRSFNLSQNYPNPFNPQTTIEFTTSGRKPETDAGGKTDRARSRVLLTVHDIRGRLVCTLVDRCLPAGLHRITWDGTDANGHRVSSGIYFSRLTVQDRSETRKMVVVE